MTEFSSTRQPPNEAKQKPKRSRVIKDALMLALEREAEVEGKMTRRIVMMADAIVRKAAEGDVAAFTAIADRIEGKPAQTIEHQGDSENPLSCLVVTYVKPDHG